MAIQPVLRRLDLFVVRMDLRYDYTITGITTPRVFPDGEGSWVMR